MHKCLLIPHSQKVLGIAFREMHSNINQVCLILWRHSTRKVIPSIRRQVNAFSSKEGTKKLVVRSRRNRVIIYGIIIYQGAGKHMGEHDTPTIFVPPKTLLTSKFFTQNFNEHFLNIFPNFQKEWVECINGQLIVELIFYIILGGWGFLRR